MVGIPIVRLIALVRLRLEVLESTGIRGVRQDQYDFSLRKINGYSTPNKPVVLTKCVRMGITRMIPRSVPCENFDYCTQATDLYFR